MNTSVLNFIKNKISILIVILVSILTAPSANAQKQIAKLLASDGKAEDLFGSSVSLSGNFAIVGAPYHSAKEDWDGAAYIFKFNGTTWVEEKKLTASNGYSYNNFGYSVAIDGNIAVVGSIGYNSFKGAVYVYKYNGTSWIEQQILTASDAAQSDMLGYSVDIDGNAIVAGAPGKGISKGAAYVFRYNGSSWVEEDPLSVSDGIVFSYFGCSAAISNNIPFIGASGDYINGEKSGSSYIFQKDGNAWVRTAKLLPKNGGAFDRFAASVDISNDVVVAGARSNDYNNLDAGAAFVYRKTGSTWELEQMLMACDGEYEDHFGDVAVDGEIIVVGANNDDDNGINAGAAYAYMWDGESWIEEYKLKAEDGFAEDWFGSAISISGNNVLIGSPQDNDKGTSAGSAYVFELKENIANYHTIFKEEFEGMIFPPAGWSVKKYNQTGYWRRAKIPETLCFSNIKGSSIYSAICPLTASDQDEWLISPSFSLGNGKAYLKFYGGHDSQNYGNYLMHLYVSADNGENWNLIWESEKHGLTWRWRQVVIDLTPLANTQNLKLGWRLIGKNEMAVGIDGILLKAEEGYTNIVEDDIQPIDFYLSQNYPNPFNPSTSIQYAIGSRQFVQLKVNDVLGKEAAVLVNEAKEPGSYEIKFDASSLSSGIYFYQLTAGKFIETRKMILMK
jgi:hypothetical protein